MDTATEAERADPTIRDVELAQRRLVGAVRGTPVLESRALNGLVGSRTRFKCELFQRGGSHKLRGALNWALARRERGSLDGVVTASSGNHAQAMAIACGEVGALSIVVMPEGSNAYKRIAAESYGARIETLGVDGMNREAVADRLADELGYERNRADSVDGIAGFGTLGLEVAALSDVDAILVPVGIGALLAGVATSIKHVSPRTRVIGVEPALGDDVQRSLAAGTIVSLASVPDTIADGARTLAPSPRTFSIISRRVDDVVTVTEAEIVEAVRLLWTRLKVVVEPTAALSFAAVLSGAVSGRLVCVLSGGNVDLDAIGGLLGPTVHHDPAPLPVEINR